MFEFFLKTLTAAMAAANTGAAAGAAPAMNPYTQAPFMTVLPTHQHSQIHLHLPQHGDAGANVGSQRSQVSKTVFLVLCSLLFWSLLDKIARLENCLIAI